MSSSSVNPAPPSWSSMPWGDRHLGGPGAHSEFVDARVDGVAPPGVRDPVPTGTGRHPCGLDPAAVRAAARLYAAGRPSMSVHGLGVTGRVQGSTPGQVPGQPGAAHRQPGCSRRVGSTTRSEARTTCRVPPTWGASPTHLTGYAPFGGGSPLEEVWRAPIPTTPGLDAMAMLDAAGGELRALWVVGWDLLLTQPNLRQPRAGLGRDSTGVAGRRRDDLRPPGRSRRSAVAVPHP